ncbi:hypothetical protein ONE63_001048 [Megalurothrips usitatus]|uniref:C2H2-type domain-containing protein n=1 Tax=Megalurothrips usitatus TaxID=439358 RepID=A0AAV7XAZ1_9NEOP|nr:hypothetical protein ONE63_001048 [Megalurothrips usitatus]
MIFTHPVQIPILILLRPKPIRLRNVPNLKQGLRRRKLVCKLVEHLTSKHSDEKSVKEVLALPPRKKERALAIGKLRTAGTLKHNQEVLASGKGVLLCKKRVTEPNAPEHFKTCGYCGSLYAAASMYKHLQKCSLKPKDGVMPSRCTKAVSAFVVEVH